MKHKLLLISFLALPLTLTAQDNAWNGSVNTSWSEDGNWSEAGGLSMGDSILFNSGSTINLATNNDLVDWLLQQITVSDPAGAVSIGGNYFTLGAGGIDLSGAAQNLTISLTPENTPIADFGTTGVMTIGANQTWHVPTGRLLTMGAIASPLDINNDPILNTVLIEGGGQVQFVTNQLSADWAGTLHVRDSTVLTEVDNALSIPNRDLFLGTGSVILENARLNFDGNKATSATPLHLTVLESANVGIGRGTNNNAVSYSFGGGLTIGDATLSSNWIGHISQPVSTLSFGPVTLTGPATFIAEDLNVTIAFTSGFTKPTDSEAHLTFRGPGLSSITSSSQLTGSPVFVVDESRLRVGVAAGSALGGADGLLILKSGEFQSFNNAAVTYNTPVNAFGDSAIWSRPNAGTRVGAAHTFGELTMNGATLTGYSDVLAGSGTQRVAFNATDTVFGYGANTFVLDRNGAAAFRLETGNNWVRQNRATMHIDILTTATEFWSTPTSPDGLVLPMATFRDSYAVTPEINFASPVGSTVGAFTAYTALPTSGGDGETAYRLQGNSTLTGNTAAFVLKLESTGAGQSLDLDGNTLSVHYDLVDSDAGAILVTGNDGFAVNNGTVFSDGQELVIHQYNAGAVTVAATLDLGAGGLTKTGTGDLILTTAQSFTGDLTVNQGTLLLQSSASVNNTGLIRIANDATFDVSGLSGFTVGASQSLVGTGSVAVGASDFVVAGEVVPGFSAGTLSFDSIGGDLVFDGSLTMEIFGFGSEENDRILFDGGTFVAGGVLNLVNNFSFSDLEDGLTVQLFSVTSNLFSGSFTEINGLTFNNNWSWDTSNLLIDGTIVAVPEPSSLLLLAGAAALLAYNRRRRRS